MKGIGLWHNRMAQEGACINEQDCRSAPQFVVHISLLLVHCFLLL